jgi:hypothetical protein
MIVRTPEGCESSCVSFGEELAPLQGANRLNPRPGGLRFAATSGYFLTTLRVAKDELAFVKRHPPIEGAEFLIVIRGSSFNSHQLFGLNRPQCFN